MNRNVENRLGIAGRSLFLLALFGLVFSLVPAAFAGDLDMTPAEKKTVFIIGNKGDGFFNFPLVAYVVSDDQLIFAEKFTAQDRGIGPVGLAVDDDNEHLFISYESSNKIEVYHAGTAEHLGTIRLQGTSDLAGMVVHQGLGQLFVIDRRQTTVFVYDTTTFNPVRTWYLENSAGAWGIDLMNDWLFVADDTDTVRYYDVDTEEEVGNFTLPRQAISIAVTDYPEPIVYTASVWDHTYLDKYTINSAVHEEVNLGDSGLGIALNPALNLIYIVVGFPNSASLGLNVLDMETLETINHYPMLMSTWNPTDCVSSFVEFGGTVSKSSPSHPDGQIGLGVQVTFEIKVQNRHVKPIHVLPLKDVYDIDQLTFVSSTPAADDSNNDGQIDWSDLVDSFDEDLGTGEMFTVQAIFRATPEDCETFVEGENMAEMIDAIDIDGDPLDNAAGSFSYKISCVCETDEDCNDGLFCNGVEVCTDLGECESPGNPCPIDDGAWCNGTETLACDEDLDECGHSGSPCPDDGSYCNGEEICQEEQQQCEHAGNPCVDDALFCNGSESCNENADVCGHSGNPCPTDTTCNEPADTCDTEQDDQADEDPEDDEGDYDPWPEGEVTGGCCGCG